MNAEEWKAQEAKQGRHHIAADSTLEAYAAEQNKALREELAALKAQNKALMEALELLYNETADYIRINNLGDVHHNVSMQKARAALQAAKEGEVNDNEQAQRSEGRLDELTRINRGMTPWRTHLLMNEGDELLGCITVLREQLDNLKALLPAPPKD